jgi:hypothetical protein
LRSLGGEAGYESFSYRRLEELVLFAAELGVEAVALGEFGFCVFVLGLDIDVSGVIYSRVNLLLGG